LSVSSHKRVDDSIPPVDLAAEARRILDGFLRERGLKQSAKRDCILNAFLGTHDHLSTEELDHIVKKRDASIGYTTVYRTLKLLVQCGLAYEVDFHDGVMRYEHSLNRRMHHHMVCTLCGDSIEFFAPEVEQVERRVGRKFHFFPSRHNFQILGVCGSCKRKNPTSKK
jgi:Fur family transcriptional regulator, ferric uptake regulator